MEYTEELLDVEGGEVIHKVLMMMRKHAHLWYGILGDIKGTEHHIVLKERVKPHRNIKYRQGYHMREKKMGHTYEKLEADVMEASKSELESKVVLETKKD